MIRTTSDIEFCAQFFGVGGTIGVGDENGR